MFPYVFFKYSYYYLSFCPPSVSPSLCSYIYDFYSDLLFIYLFLFSGFSRQGFSVYLWSISWHLLYKLGWPRTPRSLRASAC